MRRIVVMVVDVVAVLAALVCAWMLFTTPQVSALDIPTGSVECNAILLRKGNEPAISSGSLVGTPRLDSSSSPDCQKAREALGVKAAFAGGLAGILLAANLVVVIGHTAPVMINPVEERDYGFRSF